MRKVGFLTAIFLLATSVAFATAPDRRWSDSDGDVLDINSDGTVPISISDEKIVYCDTFTGAGISSCISTLGSDGGEVRLLEGTYTTSGNEIDITVDNVTIRGAGAGTIINNTGTGGEHAIKITGTDDDAGAEIENVTLADFQINGASGGGDGIRGEAADFLLLENLFIDGVGANGIYCNDCEENLRIDSCDVENNGNYGIYLENAHDTVITGTEVEANTEDGLYIKDSFNVVVAGCAFDDGVSSSIYMLDSWASVVTGNSIESSGDESIYLDGNGEHTISGNNVRGGGGSFGEPRIFISDDCDYNVISGNKFGGAGEEIEVGGDYNQIVGNSFGDQDQAGWRADGVHILSGAIYNSVIGNHFQRVTNYAVFVEGNYNSIENNVAFEREDGVSNYPDEPEGLFLIKGAMYCTLRNNLVAEEEGSDCDYGIVAYGGADFNNYLHNHAHGFQTSDISVSGANNVLVGNISGETTATDYAITGNINIDSSLWTLTTTHQYKMNDNAANTTVTDEQGTNGTSSQNTSAMSVTGKVSTALDFNGSNDEVTISGDIIGTGADSVCAWIYPTGWGGGNYGRIVDNAAFVLILDDTADTLMGTSDNSTWVVSATNSIDLNEWQFVCFTRDASGVGNFYVNGLLSGTADQATGTPGAGVGNTFIGNRTADDRCFDGYIDNVMFFASELSAANVANLAATTSHAEVLTDGEQASITMTTGHTADPCGSLGEGALFYNTTANEYCFCDGSNDLRIKDASTACF